MGRSTWYIYTGCQGGGLSRGLVEGHGIDTRDECCMTQDSRIIVIPRYKEALGRGGHKTQGRWLSEGTPRKGPKPFCYGYSNLPSATWQKESRAGLLQGPLGPAPPCSTSVADRKESPGPEHEGTENGGCLGRGRDWVRLELG